MTPRVLAQFIRWLDTLQVWPAPVTDLYRELRSGVMLCSIVKVLVPDADFKGINRKPRTMRPAVNNIEKALSVIWQRGDPMQGECRQQKKFLKVGRRESDG